MKKTSAIVYVLLAAASVFLLWLWYAMDFYLIDDPLDLVVSIVWWVCIGVGIWAVVRAENRRQERVRTVYVGEGRVFNPEKGLVEMDGRGVQDTTYALLKDLEYGFGRESMPDKEDFVPTFMVRTKEFKPEDKDEEGNDVGATWKGEVVKPDGEDRALRWTFEDPQELQEILATI